MSTILVKCFTRTVEFSMIISSLRLVIDIGSSIWVDCLNCAVRHVFVFSSIREYTFNKNIAIFSMLIVLDCTVSISAVPYITNFSSSISIDRTVEIMMCFYTVFIPRIIAVISIMINLSSINVIYVIRVSCTLIVYSLVTLCINDC